MTKQWLWVGISLLITVSVIAQDATCPAVQSDALAMIAEFCAEQTPDTLCYGNPTVSVTYTDSADESLRFALSGDSVSLTDIDWFSTSTEANTWGTARALLRAYPVDSLEAQPATMVLFGNVVLFNQGTEGITIETYPIEVALAQGANVRSLPSSEARLVEPILRGTILKASGLSEDELWIRVHTSRDDVGWVNVTAVSGDYSSLPIVPDDAGVDTLVLPLQAFNFQSGISDANCDGAPPSGILLQAPDNNEATAFNINGVTLLLNGTAFLQAQPEAGMLIHIVDGEGQLIALDAEQTVQEGYVSRIRLDTDEDGNLFAIEEPTIPLVYDYESLISLPVELLSEPARVALDIYTLITPRPIGGGSPIAGMALDAPCKFTVGETGANIRSAPDPSAPIIAVMGYRESANPIARAIGTDDLPWWKLAEGVWIRLDTTVTGGDCTSVPTIRLDG